MPKRLAQAKLKNYSNHQNKDFSKQLLSVSEGAQLLNISPSSLRRLESEGKISSIRKENGYRAFRRADVEALKNTLEEVKVFSERGSVNPTINVTDANPHYSEKAIALRNLISKIGDN